MLHWNVFSAAPHRMMFFGGFVQIMLSLMFWWFELIYRYFLGSTLPTVIPSTWAHAFLLLFCTIPFFIFGFLMTTYPRWMNGTIIPVTRYALAFKLLFVGSLLFYLGLFSNLFLLSMDVLIILGGWIAAVYALWEVYTHAHARDKHYEKVLNLSLFSAMLSISSYLGWLFTKNDYLLLFTLKAAIWLFLVPMLFTVCHRMLPFFSSSTLTNYHTVQPSWSLAAMGICSVGHFSIELFNQLAWLWLFDLPFLAIAIYHAVIWQFWRSFPVKLLAVLYIAFLWLSIALVLYTAQSLWLLLTGELLLGKAPLHALTIGFMSSLLVGMVSRVSLGHSGRVLLADQWTWYCFLGVSGIAVLRILAEIAVFNQLISLNIIAASVWLIVFGAWTWHYLPFTILPRVDGKTG